MDTVWWKTMIATYKMSNPRNNDTMMTKTTRSFPAAFNKQPQRGGYGGQRRPYHPRPPTAVVEKKAPTVNVASELDFPTLGGKDSWSAPAAASAGAGFAGKSFASMATSWKAEDDAEADRIAYEKEAAEQEAAKRREIGVMSRVFSSGSSRHYETYRVSGDEYDEEEAPPRHPFSAPDDGWNLVDRAAKRPVAQSYYDEECDDYEECDEGEAW